MPDGFVTARTCYDHLAGEMAVQVLEAMLEAGWLAPEGRDYTVSARGRRQFEALGIDLEQIGATRRPVARSCVDLTQRRPHLAGALGAALLECCVRNGWVLRTAGSRVVTITPKGHAAFRDKFGVAAAATHARLSTPTSS
jgi:hypothetical protein